MTEELHLNKALLELDYGSKRNDYKIKWLVPNLSRNKRKNKAGEIPVLTLDVQLASF